MKAIVLTCDKFMPFADHMLRTYQASWPDNPFTFRVPYQEFPESLKQEHGGKVELIQTPRAIKATVLKLVDDLPEDEWVYWCIDDKYLISFDKDEVEKTLAWLPEIEDRTLCGVSVYGSMKKGLDLDDRIENEHGQIFFLRKGHARAYNGIWTHQFLRVRALREFMGILPDDYLPVPWEELIETVPEPKVCMPDRKFYILGWNTVTFGESTAKRRMTKNCLNSFKDHGLPVPPGIKKSKKSRIWRGKKFYDIRI